MNLGRTIIKTGITLFATRGSGISILLIAMSFSATSCKQQAGRGLLAGEVEEQAQQIASLEAIQQNLLAEQIAQSKQISSKIETTEKEIEQLLQAKKAAQIELEALQAEFDSLKINPPAPSDTIVLANGKTVEGYIENYANGVFSVIMPNGETKKGRTTSFKSIEFKTKPATQEPSEIDASTETML